MNSVLCSYLCFAKNKIKWTGSLENLKAFVLAEVDDETAEKTSWRLPSGGTWVFDSELLSVTWHSKSKNINFGGEKGKALTERIHSYLLKEHDTILQATNSGQSDQEGRTETFSADNISKLTIGSSKDLPDIAPCISAEESENEENEADLKNQQGGNEEASHIRNSNEDTSDNFTTEIMHNSTKTYTKGLRNRIMSITPKLVC